MMLKALIILSFVAIAGCGIKGPPLPPVPEVQQPPPVVEQPKTETPAADAIKTIKKKKKTK